MHTSCGCHNSEDHADMIVLMSQTACEWDRVSMLQYSISHEEGNGERGYKRPPSPRPLLKIATLVWNIGFTKWYTNKTSNYYSIKQYIVHSCCLCMMLFRILVILGMNPQIKYLLSDSWMLLPLQPDTGREGGLLYVQVDIPERPVEVQQNRRAKGGSPFSPSCSHTHTHKRDVFHIPGLFVSLFWLLERGSECWHEVWNADGDFGWW